MAKREEWINNKKRNSANGIGDLVYSTMKPVMANYSKLEADLILNWSKIFDRELARKISYKKLVFTDKKANRFILYVNIANKDILEITHATEIIKEQLAIFLGFQGCEKVVVNKIS
jgi:hypothetical protein